jgi:O-antigen ligase
MTRDRTVASGLVASVTLGQETMSQEAPVQPPPAVTTRPTRRRASTSAYRVSRFVLLIPLVVTLDVFNYFDQGGPARYALPLLAVIPVLVYWLRVPSTLVRRPTSGDGFLAILWLFALIGTTYAIVFNRLSATTRPMVASMGVAFLYLLVLDSPTEEEAGRILRALCWITTLYVLLAAVVNIGLIPHLLEFRQYRNAQFAFVTGALTAAFVLRRWWLLAFLAALEVVNFVGYPSATSVLGLLAMVGTLYMTGARASKFRAYGLVALSSLMVLVSVLNIRGTLGLLTDYFSGVGKYNATAVRLELWATGLDQFRTSPFFGRGFASLAVATATRVTGSTVKAPYHNDLLLFLAEGGVVGLGLFLLWIVATEATLLHRYAGFRDTGRWARAGLIRVFLVMFNTFVVSAVFNPTFNQISPSATLFALYGVVMLLGSPISGRKGYLPRPFGQREREALSAAEPKTTSGHL